MRQNKQGYHEQDFRQLRITEKFKHLPQEIYHKVQYIIF